MIGGMTVFDRRGTRAERCCQRADLLSGGEERAREPPHAPPEGGAGEAGERRKEAGLGANGKEVKQGQDCWLEQVQGEGETTSPSLSMMARL